MHVGLGREGRMHFQRRAPGIKGNAGKVVDGHHDMGIPHPNGSHFQLLALQQQHSLRQSVFSISVGECPPK